MKMCSPSGARSIHLLPTSSVRAGRAAREGNARAGVTRNYTYEIDRPCQKANQQLVASIPMKYKQGEGRRGEGRGGWGGDGEGRIGKGREREAEGGQGVKEHLRPLGFTGFKLEELTPNKTRRAQCVNWLLFYREALRGKTLEQLRAERAAETGNEVTPKVAQLLPTRDSLTAKQVVGPQSRQTRSDDGETMVDEHAVGVRGERLTRVQIEQKDWKYPSKPVL
eukprot:763488-Hanusia_phi.AAC.1